MTKLEETAGISQQALMPERGSVLYLSGVCTVAALGRFAVRVRYGGNFRDHRAVEDAVCTGGGHGRLGGQFGPCGLHHRGHGGGNAERPIRAEETADRGGRAVSGFRRWVRPSRRRRACWIAARLVGGLGVGFASMLAPLYISELSPPHLRGRMVALYQFAITVGVVAAYFSNAFLLHLAENYSGLFGQDTLRWIFVDELWRGMFGAEVLPACLFLLLLLTVPESPRWLTKQQRDDEAASILARVGGRETGDAADG